MRRCLSIWLRHWPTDRWRRSGDGPAPGAGPLALVASGQGGIRLTAVNAAAAAEGLVPGVTLGDARAVLPHLQTAQADPAADAAALAALAHWATRYSPLVATDGDDGLILDITGCSALFGGEAALLADALARLARAGIDAHGGIADSPAAAWAWARQCGAGPDGGIIPPAGAKAALAPLPLAALRLEADLLEALSLAGLRRIGDIADLPRAPLAARFGSEPRRRLDLALGRRAEPINPLRPVVPWCERLALAEPISRREDIETAAHRLLARLCRRLEAAGLGARRLTLQFHRVDATLQELAIGTGQPSRDPAHLLRLFREGFDGVAPDFGIEVVLLSAPETDRLAAVQSGLEGAGAADAPAALPRLLDTLQARLGRGRVGRLVALDSHWPERAQALRPVLARRPPRGAPAPAFWRRQPARPVLLFHPPRAIDLVSPEQDGRLAVLRWQGRTHRVAAVEGPERIDPEWWRDGDGAGWRDYYRIEDDAGRRYWIFRQGEPPRWFLHGLFA